ADASAGAAAPVSVSAGTTSLRTTSEPDLSTPDLFRAAAKSPAVWTSALPTTSAISARRTQARPMIGDSGWAPAGRPPARPRPGRRHGRNRPADPGPDGGRPPRVGLGMGGHSDVPVPAPVAIVEGRIGALTQLGDIDARLVHRPVEAQVEEREEGLFVGVGRQ